jgi:hypothetical protein
MSETPISRTIVFAIQTHQRIRELEAQLELCKTQIREFALLTAAEKSLDETPQVEIVSEAGTITVVFVKDRFCLKEGFTPAKIRSDLSPELAAVLVELRPALRSDAEESFRNESLHVQAALTGFVHWAPQTPRLLFPK